MDELIASAKAGLSVRSRIWSKGNEPVLIFPRIVPMIEMQNTIVTESGAFLFAAGDVIVVVEFLSRQRCS